MTPRSQIRQAASALRTHTRAIPGFCEALPDLLEAAAAHPETRELALAVAQDIRPPRRRTAQDRTERNEHA